MPVSLKDTGVLFGGTAPHGLKELYGETFVDGGSAPAYGFYQFTGVSRVNSPPCYRSLRYMDAYCYSILCWYDRRRCIRWAGCGRYRLLLGIQSEWRIAARVGTDTSLYSHGPTPTNTGIYRPSFIWMGGGFLTPTQYSILPGSSGQFGYINVGIVYLNGGWVKTTNQTS